MQTGLTDEDAIQAISPSAACVAVEPPCYAAASPRTPDVPMWPATLADEVAELLAEILVLDFRKSHQIADVEFATGVSPRGYDRSRLDR